MKYIFSSGKLGKENPAGIVSWRTLDTYSHLYPDKDQQLADRLNQFRRAVPPAEEFP